MTDIFDFFVDTYVQQVGRKPIAQVDKSIHVYFLYTEIEIYEF